jgi:hypothetical protein
LAARIQQCKCDAGEPAPDVRREAVTLWRRKRKRNLRSSGEACFEVTGERQLHRAGQKSAIDRHTRGERAAFAEIAQRARGRDLERAAERANARHRDPRRTVPGAGQIDETAAVDERRGAGSMAACSRCSLPIVSRASFAAVRHRPPTGEPRLNGPPPCKIERSNRRTGYKLFRPVLLTGASERA